MKAPLTGRTENSSSQAGSDQQNASPATLENNRPEALQLSAMKDMTLGSLRNIAQRQSINGAFGSGGQDAYISNTALPEIHLGPGQEKHLPHEAWHVVRQKQRRVKPTLQAKNGMSINNDRRLDKEADVMGQKALQGKSGHREPLGSQVAINHVVQRMLQSPEEEDEIPGHFKQVTDEIVLMILGILHNTSANPEALLFRFITGALVNNEKKAEQESKSAKEPLLRLAELIKKDLIDWKSTSVVSHGNILAVSFEAHLEKDHEATLSKGVWYLNPMCENKLKDLLYNLLFQRLGTECQREIDGAEGAGILGKDTKDVEGIAVSFTKRVDNDDQQKVLKMVKQLHDEITEIKPSELAQEVISKKKRITGRVMNRWQNITKTKASVVSSRRKLGKRIVFKSTILKLFTQAKTSLLEIYASKKIRLVVDRANSKLIFGDAKATNKTDPKDLMAGKIAEKMKKDQMIRINLDATGLTGLKTTLIHELAHVAGFNPSEVKKNSTSTSGERKAEQPSQMPEKSNDLKDVVAGGNVEAKTEPMTKLADHPEKEGHMVNPESYLAIETDSLPKIFFDAYFMETIYDMFIKKK